MESMNGLLINPGAAPILPRIFITHWAEDNSNYLNRDAAMQDGVVSHNTVLHSTFFQSHSLLFHITIIDQQRLVNESCHKDYQQSSTRYWPNWGFNPVTPGFPLTYEEHNLTHNQTTKF